MSAFSRTINLYVQLYNLHFKGSAFLLQVPAIIIRFRNENRNQKHIWNYSFSALETKHTYYGLKSCVCLQTFLCYCSDYTWISVSTIGKHLCLSWDLKLIWIKQMSVSLTQLSICSSPLDWLCLKSRKWWSERVREYILQ